MVALRGSSQYVRVILQSDVVRRLAQVSTATIQFRMLSFRAVQ